MGLAHRCRYLRYRRLVPLAGLEPARCFHHLILSQARLPIPPQGHGAWIIAAGPVGSTHKWSLRGRQGDGSPPASEDLCGVIPGRVRSTRARNPYPTRRGYGSRLAASDLGFTRDRHWIMRTSATADVRWRPGTTSDAVGLVAMRTAPRALALPKRVSVR